MSNMEQWSNNTWSTDFFLLSISSSQSTNGFWLGTRSMIRRYSVKQEKHYALSRAQPIETACYLHKTLYGWTLARHTPRNTAGRTALYGDFAGSLISTFYGYRDTLLHKHVQWVVWNLQLFSRWKTIIDQQSGQTMWHIIISRMWVPWIYPWMLHVSAYTCQRCQKWSPHVGEYPTDGASRMFVSWIIFFG